MIGRLPPGALLIVGAILIPLLPHRVRGVYTLALPAASLVATIMTPAGTYGAFELFAYELVPVRVDKLVFKDLRKSLKLGAKEASIATWQSAMEKCYACHQGQDGVKRWRKFVPNQAEHGHHSKIGAQFGLACDTCHKGKTSMVGYQ